MPRLLPLLLLTSLLSAGGAAAVADDSASRPSYTVEDLAWLSGQWQGENLEEAWGEPRDGVMLGMFRATGRQAFYEIMELATDPGTAEDPRTSVELRIKHFSPGLVGWETKDESVLFRLVSLDGRRAEFEDEKGARLVYEGDDDRLVVLFYAEGSDEAMRFEMRKRG